MRSFGIFPRMSQLPDMALFSSGKSEERVDFLNWVLTTTVPNSKDRFFIVLNPPINPRVFLWFILMLSELRGEYLILR